MPVLNEEVSSDDIAEIVARWTGIPVSRMLKVNMKNYCAYLSIYMRVVGQHQAIETVSDAVLKHVLASMIHSDPPGVSFFGPTGVGKTEQLAH